MGPQIDISDPLFLWKKNEKNERLEERVVE
jgi:hypothetical protein